MMVKEKEGSTIMTANREFMFWNSNEEWYGIDEVTHKFVLTEKAPERAQKSFELYKKVNNIKDESDFAKTYF